MPSTTTIEHRKIAKTVVETLGKEHTSTSFSCTFKDGKWYLFVSNWWLTEKEEFLNRVEELQKDVVFKIEYCHSVTQLIKKSQNELLNLNTLDFTVSRDEFVIDDNHEYQILDEKGAIKYIVTKKRGNYSCSCPGYTYRRRCKHIDAAKAEHFFKE